MINNKEKVNILNERLRCLALLEYNASNKSYMTINDYTERYITKFIAKVLNNKEIMESLDQRVPKN